MHSALRSGKEKKSLFFLEKALMALYLYFDTTSPFETRRLSIVILLEFR